MESRQRGGSDLDPLVLIKRLVRARRIIFTKKADVEMERDGLTGMTYHGVVVYTKGKIALEEGNDRFYVLISSKRSTDVR